jgi:hypothetical protein
MGDAVKRTTRLLGYATCLLVACGEVYADPIQAPYNFGRTAIDAGPLPVTKPAPVECPTEVQANSPCDIAGAACEFGPSSDRDCNTTFICMGSPYGAFWAEQTAPHCAGVCPLPTEIVPDAPCNIPAKPDSGLADDALELQCAGPKSLCACTTGPGGANVHPRKWVCVPAGEGCPIQRPNFGRPCLGDKTCDYGSCEFKRGTGMICEQGVWQVEAQSCR